MKVNVVGVSSKAIKKATSGGTAEESSTLKKGPAAILRDNENKLDNDDVHHDDDSDGFLVLSEKNHEREDEDDDDTSKSDSSWNQVDEKESSSAPPPPPAAIAAKKVSMIRSSLNYDGYIEVDDDSQDKTSSDKNDVKTKNNNEPAADTIDSSLDQEGYSLLKKQEEEEDFNKNREQEDDRDGEPLVVVDGVLMVGNTSGRITVRLLLLIAVLRLLLGVGRACSSSINSHADSESVIHASFCNSNVTTSLGSGSGRRITNDVWLNIMAMPTSTPCKVSSSGKSNAIVRISNNKNGSGSSSGSSLALSNGSSIQDPAKNKNDKDQRVYPYWISQANEDAYLMKLFEKHQNTPHEPYITIEFLKAMSRMGSHTLEQSSVPSSLSEEQQQQKLYYALFDMDVASTLRRRRQEHNMSLSLSTTTSDFPTIDQYGTRLEPLYTVEVQHAPVDQKWNVFKQDDFDHVMSWRRCRHDHNYHRSRMPLKSCPSSRVLFSAQPRRSRGRSNQSSNAIGFANKLSSMTVESKHYFGDERVIVRANPRSSNNVENFPPKLLFMEPLEHPQCGVANTAVQNFTQWNFSFAHDVFLDHHCHSGFYSFSFQSSRGLGDSAHADYASSSRFWEACKSAFARHQVNRYSFLSLLESKANRLPCTVDLADAVAQRFILDILNVWNHHPVTLYETHRSDHRLKGSSSGRHFPPSATSRAAVGFPVEAFQEHPPQLCVIQNNDILNILQLRAPKKTSAALVLRKQMMPWIHKTIRRVKSEIAESNANTTTLSAKETTKTTAFGLPQLKISWIHKSIKNNMTILVPHLHIPTMSRKNDKLSSSGGLIVREQASLQWSRQPVESNQARSTHHQPRIVWTRKTAAEEANAAIFMPHLQMRAPRQAKKRNTADSTDVAHSEGAAQVIPTRIEQNITTALDIAHLQTQLNPKIKKNVSKRNNGALVVLKQPMSPIAPVAPHVPEPVHPLTIIVSSQNNHSQVSDQPTGLVLVNNPWKTHDLGSVPVFLAARSMIVALILMNKKDLSVINYGYKTTASAISVLSASDPRQYGMHKNEGWNKIQESFYSLVLQIDLNENDDSVSDWINVGDDNTSSGYSVQSTGPIAGMAASSDHKQASLLFEWMPRP